jgi:hypothetical protein
LPPPHAVEQVWLSVLQLWPVGQSVAALQPQPAPERQECPLMFDEQSTQARPPLPQVPLSVPALHEPPAQQPPLHAWLGLHALVQLAAPTLHASCVLQSLLVLQPQAPPSPLGRHTWPALAPLHDAHTAPPRPQAPLATPLAHTPETGSLQQP